MKRSILKIFIKLKLDEIGFFKKDNIYQITKITGSQDNFLGVTFTKRWL